MDDVSALPPKVAGLVEVYRCSLMLSREACLSPPLTSQTFGYLFFFTNTSLLNTLLERGEKAAGVTARGGKLNVEVETSQIHFNCQ